MRIEGLNRQSRIAPLYTRLMALGAAWTGVFGLMGGPQTSHAYGPATPSLTATTLNSSIDGDGAYTFAGFAAAGLTVHRISVQNLVVGDEVTVVFADGTSPLTIRTDATSFFNAPDVGQLHSRPSAGQFSTTPSLQWDTWLAIGNVAFFVTPGFPNVALESGGASVIDNTDMAWFAIPGFVTSDGTALIGQFAFAEGSSFELNISINVKRGTETLEFRDLAFTSGDPIDPTGACCVETVCSEVLESDCKTSGGTFHGADTLCSRVSCEVIPDPTGACCIEGKCVEVTEDVCDVLGSVVVSVYHGDGSLCSETDCAAEIPGACCIEGECVQVVESLCTLSQGTFEGEGVACTITLCTPPVETGACCIFGDCVELTEVFCQLSTGTFSGIGTTCDATTSDLCANGPPTTGACCIAGECTMLTEAQCELAFGEFLAVGIDCEGTTCPAVGACCVTGVCIQVSQTICDVRGGVFTEEGEECIGVVCELPAAVGSGGTGDFWKAPGLPRWPAPYRKSTPIHVIFAIPSCITDGEINGRELVKGITMYAGDSEINIAARRLMRQAVPALLNARVASTGKCDAAYPIADDTLVVQLVNAALTTCDAEQILQLADTLLAYNSLVRPVSRAGSCTDEWENWLELNQ